MMKRYQSFPIRSWMDLPHVCDTSSCLAFHFRDHQNYYYLLLTLSTSLSLVFLIPGTFHPMRWSLFSSCCPASKTFFLDSNPLNLALTGKPDVRLIKTLYYPRSDMFSSRRGYQMFRGPRDLHRRPSIRLFLYKFLQLNRF